MSKTTSINHVLFWKEARQVTPLIAMLLSVGAVLILFWSGLTLATSNLAYAGRYLPLVLPALYAAGVGAVQIGQEKELRTIGWLSSLPISPQRLFWTKFTVALLGLAAMWICCGLLVGLIIASGLSVQAAKTELAFVDANDMVYFPLHSLFILTCGMFASWRFRNTFAILLLIVPLAFVPSLVVSMVSQVLAGQGDERSPSLLEQSPTFTFIITALAAMLMTWLAYRVSVQTLAPADPPKLLSGPKNWLEPWRPTGQTHEHFEPFRYRISSLIWQSIHHNRWGLAGLVTMIAIGAFCGATVSFSKYTYQFNETTLGIGTLAGFLGISWLGLFVFTGDGSERGLRFLADRGATPATVWLGRQWIGLSVLSMGVLLFAIISLNLLNDGNHLDSPAYSVTAVTLMALCTYGVSQWTSQILRLTAAAALVAPLLSTAAITWLAFAATELQAPYWLILFVGSLPLIATFSMMSRFMDGRSGWAFYLSSLAMVILFIVLPRMPFLIDILNTPRMSKARQMTLLAECKNLSKNTAKPWQLMRHDFNLNSNSNRIDVDALMTGADAIVFQRQNLASMTDRFHLAELSVDSPSPIHADKEFLIQAISGATYSLMAFRLSPNDQSNQAACEQWIVNLTRLGKGLRLSNRWQDQTAADAVEIWLTQTLTSTPLNSMIDRDSFQVAMALISDHDTRNRSRYRAVLMSWRNNEFLNLSETGLNVPVDDWGGPMSQTKRRWVRDRLHERFIDASLQLIDKGSQGHSTVEILRELHQIRCGTQVAFNDGPYADRLRVGPGEKQAFSIAQMYSYPASQWYAEWETEAARLNKVEVK